MASLEDEIKDLKEKNNELAQKVQYWKMTAAQRDDEKLALMKENNELRLKLSRLRNNGGIQAQKLDTALQAASEKAISHLVKASAEIAKSMEIAKAYMRERQELEAHSPRWSGIGGTPAVEKCVHRVPPMMMGGQPIQPVVALSRTTLNSSNPRSESRSSNPNRTLTERAVPMHMLQDVYIPLTRIDVSDLPNNNIETNTEPNIPEGSVHDLTLDDDDEDESDGHISEEDEYDTCKQAAEEERPVRYSNEIPPLRLRLHLSPRYDYMRTDPAVTSTPGSHRPSQQDSQPQASHSNTPQEERTDGQRDNPLEGPSWLLDSTPTTSKEQTPKTRVNLEPDSTTEPDTSVQRIEDNTQAEGSPAVREFSPTVRRRKRTSSPVPLATPRQSHYSPRPGSARRNSISGRVLKVMVAKMRLDESPGESSPPKRARSPALSVTSFDAPSPNGATDSRVIVSETRNLSRRESRDSQVSIVNSQDGHELTQRSRLSQDDSIQGGNSEQEARKVNTQDKDSTNRQRGRVSRQSADGSRSRALSHDSRDSDSGSGGAGDCAAPGRTRRARKPITYKEKPLNRKLRR